MAKTERSPLEVIQQLAQLLPDLKYSTIRHSYIYIYMYLDIIIKQGRAPTTFELVRDIPKLLMAQNGPLADLWITKFDITYSSLKQVMETLVSIEELSYGLKDSPKHFDRNSSLLEDVKNYIQKHYTPYLEKKINGNPSSTNN